MHTSSTVRSTLQMTRERTYVALTAIAIVYVAGYTAGPLAVPGRSEAVQLIAGQTLAALGVIAVASAARIPLLPRGTAASAPGGRTAAGMLVGSVTGAASGLAAAGAALLLRGPVDIPVAAGVEMLLVVLALTAGAALSEELVFRHLGYRLVLYTGSRLRATLVSTGLFVAAHSTQGFDPLQATTVAAAGLLLARIYRKHGYLSAVACHGTFNLAIITLMTTLT